VPICLRAALAASEPARDANQIFFGVVRFLCGSEAIAAAPKFEGARKSGARILEIGVWPRALMATADRAVPDSESQVEVDAVLSEIGATMDQVRRWREGLLPDVVQEQTAFRGSLVRYPKGTAHRSRLRKHSLRRGTGSSP
jgi:hypothetical protein